MTAPAFDNGAPPAENPWRTVTRWLIVINVAIFVLDYFILRMPRAVFAIDPVTGQAVQLTPAQPILAFYGHFSVDFAISKLQVWRFVTYQFLHANLEHILLNMLGLLLAGPVVERRMGRGRYLLFYLVCGMAGPAAHIALSMLGVMSLNVYTPLVGASASIYGVLVAAAAIAPDEIVELALPPIDMKLRTFALLMVALSLFAVAWRWQNAGGHAAHLGGALAGWFLSRHFSRPATPPA